MMRIVFDRGTLVFRDVPDGVAFDLGELRGVRFDPRVNAFRARACDREEVLVELMRRNIDVADDTQRALAPPRLPRALDENLRPYQEKAVQAWEASQRRGVIVAPTGSGKTKMALAAIARAACRTLIIVPTKVLLEQWHETLESAGVKNIGRYGDRAHELAAVTIATIESAWRHMPVIGDAFELIVVDEVHRIAGESRAEALEMSVAPFRLGLTATIDMGAASRVEALVGPVVHTSTLDDLAGQYLAPFELVVVPVELLKSEREIYEGHMMKWRRFCAEESMVAPDAGIDELVKRARKTEQGRAALEALRCARAVCAYPAQKRVMLRALLAEHRRKKKLVFTPDNKTAWAVAKDHLIAPITCTVKKSERVSVLEKFRNGELLSLVSSQVLNEGVDVPDAELAIVVGGRAGEREHIQRIGRVLRPAPGKQALVFELVVPRTMEVRAGERRRRSMMMTGRGDDPTAREAPPPAFDEGEPPGEDG